jgi:RNA recognition motif-containing protein
MYRIRRKISFWVMVRFRCELSAKDRVNAVGASTLTDSITCKLYSLTANLISNTMAPMKLLIRNLARTTTEEELRALFQVYGKVQSCSLVLDKKSGRSKGFGFVVMPSPGESKAAMKNLNGKDVDGNSIRVKKSQPKPEMDQSKE